LPLTFVNEQEIECHSLERVFCAKEARADAPSTISTLRPAWVRKGWCYVMMPPTGPTAIDLHWSF
jgi:hypothetical protein